MSNLRLAFWIARRYLFSRRLSASINVLSWVSVLGIGLGSCALVLVLSVFNGFQGLIGQLFQKFDPDIKILPAQGLYFQPSDSLEALLASQPGVEAVSATLEGRAMARFRDNQAIVRLKGVRPDFTTVSKANTLVYVGSFTLEEDQEATLVLGSGVALALAASLAEQFEPIALFGISPGSNLLGDPLQAVNQAAAYPTGIFSLQKEYDDQYVITTLQLARQVLGTEGYSAYELRIAEDTKLEATRASIEALLGPNWRVLSWYGQHETLFNVLRAEKQAGYLILVLMLLVAGSTIVGNLSMIVVEKRGDVAMLLSMGARRGFIQQLFMAEGLLISGLATAFGLGLGFVLAFLQQQFELIQIGGGDSFVVQAFPVSMQLADFALVFATVLVLSLLASYVPARRAARLQVVRLLG